MILNIFSMFLILDQICVKHIQDFKNYSSGVNVKLLDDLLLIENKEVE